MMSTFGREAIKVDAGGALDCPDCGDNYLHHGNVTIFQRSEDDDFTTVIAQSGTEAQVSDFPSADTCNPSSRRHGMIIEFECEYCHNDAETPKPPHRLAVIQHKGNTYMEWL
jgi:hypothetical protein